MKNINTFFQHLKEALEPNFVIKSGSSSFEPKDYLLDVNGNVFRGTRARTYERGSFRGIKQYYMDFSGADFSGVDMRDALFKHCNFDGADMSDVDAYEARFFNCSFVGAIGIDNLNAKFHECSF